jgi:hypothetical protein
MASTSTAKKIVPSAPAPKIHPEMAREVRKKKPAKKPVAKKVAPKAAAPKSKRVQLVSVREANSVIDQARIAFSVSAIGAVIGILLGSSIPLTTFMISHFEWQEWWSIYTLLIIGGLGFSFKNVYQWGKAAFRDSWKAGAFVLLCEGSMVFSKILWLEWMCLGILIGINAIASGANLVIKPPQVMKKPSWES